LRALSGLTGLTTSPAPGTFKSFLSSIKSPALRAIAEHWQEARGTRRMPSWSAFGSRDLSPHFKLLWGYRYDLETGQFTVHLAGNKLRKWVEPSFCGGRLQDQTTRSIYEDVRQYLTKIVTTPLAGRSSGRLFTVGDFAVPGERIALPIATDGKTGDGIFGASDYVSPPLLGPAELVHENVEWYRI